MDGNEMRIASRQRHLFSRAAIFVAAMLTFELVAGFVAAPAVFAACNPGRAHDNIARYVATIGSPASLTAVQSQILEYDPFYTGTNPTGTNATIMLANAAASKWVQLGWFKERLHVAGVTKRELGVEVFRSIPDNHFFWWDPNPVGTTTAYAIYYRASVNLYDFYNGASVIYTEHGIDGQQTQYQIFGETHDKADQMPGTPASREKFTGSKYFTGAGYTVHTVTTAMGASDPAVGGKQEHGGGWYDIWDLGC